MATQTSPTTGQRYGVSRVCQIWALARSSFYAAGQQKAAVTRPPPRQRPGPKPAITDEALLAAIHAGLERSPWTGEGHLISSPCRISGRPSGASVRSTDRFSRR